MSISIKVCDVYVLDLSQQSHVPNSYYILGIDNIILNKFNKRNFVLPEFIIQIKEGNSKQVNLKNIWPITWYYFYGENKAKDKDTKCWGEEMNFEVEGSWKSA